MSDDTETTFPSTTFGVEFNGCGAMKPDFKGDVKFSVDDLPRVLTQMHDLRCKKGMLTFVSDQAQIPDGGANDDWAHPELTEDDESDIEYERTCVGPKCRPYFCVPQEGDLVGEYVCYKDPHALMVCVRGETPCPMYPQAETTGNADDDGVDELPIEDENTSTGADPEAVVNVWYPGEEHARITDVGPSTHYGEFVADYLATLPPKDAHKNDSLGLYRVVDNLSNECALGVIVEPAEYGSSFWVEAVAKAEEPAA